MQISISQSPEGVILQISGIMKKPDGIELSNQLANLGRNKPASLILDVSNLAAASNDSIPFMVSALERLRIGKNKVTATGANPVVKRTLIGCGFERVGKVE